ncbi:uncharacterized mitochondrial protein-like protein [Tanacetum coccineum]
MKFFLGLQIHQSPRGIFINQSQYTMKLLRKHEMKKCDIVTTPMAIAKIDEDLHGTPTDQTKYRSMIRGLMYLTTSRPDIAFATFVCARYQARRTEKHLKEMQIWQGCLDDYKSTSKGIQFLGDKLVSWSSKKKDCTTMLTVKAENLTAEYFKKKTVSKVPDTEDTIMFKLDRQEIIYTVDMFYDTLHLPVETQDNPLIALVNIRIIESFMQRVGYQGVVDKDKKNKFKRYGYSTVAEGDLKKFSDIGAWYAKEDCAQYDKKSSNPTSAISDETIANPNVQIVGDDMVRVKVPRCMAWLDYDEHVDNLSRMDNENAGNLSNRNQAFNAGNGNDESNQIVQRVPRTESNPRKANLQCYNCNEKCHYARDCQKPRVHDAKYFREQMLLAIKDEVGSNLKDEENDFMLDNSYRDETFGRVN